MEAIADGILTWHMWPGFQGVHCDECGCEMNVMGMSYGHMCPDCEEEATRKDPEFRHYVMQSMHNHGMMPFDTPRFGPTRATLRRGGQLADEISESKRRFALGQRVLVRDWAGPRLSGTVVALEPSSWPGMRWYRVDIDGGRENQHTYESDMAPLIEDMVSAPPAPMSIESRLVDNGTVCEEDIRPGANPDCRWCKGTGEVTLATATRECLDCWPDGVPAAAVPAAVTRVSSGAAIPESEYITVEPHSGYGDKAVSVESLERHHSGGQKAFVAWWQDNRRRPDGEYRCVVALPPGEVAGVFVEDYLDWVARKTQETAPPPESGGGDWEARAKAERDRGLANIFLS